MDVYALGVILYLAHAGRMPLYNSDPTAMMGLALSVDPEPLARISKSVSPGVAELAHQMLAKEAQTRLTMHQVRDRLAHLLGLSGSRPEFVSIRPTGEHQAMLARFDTAQQEEGLANTADALAAGVQRSPDRRGVTPSTAPKIARSGGERSIDLQLASGDLILSTGRGAGQQLTGPDTLARRSTKRMVVLGLLGVVVVGTSGAVAVQRLALRPKQSVAITQSTPLTPVQPAPLVVTALPTQVPTNVTPQTVTPSTPPHISLIPEPKQPKQRGGCVAPTADCISGRASPAQQGLILDALQEADFKFCQGNRLVLTGNPILKVRTSSGVNHNRLDSFLYTARGKLKNSTFAGEVEIKCKGK